MTLRAKIFGGQGTLTLAAPYDARGTIVLTGPDLLPDFFADWLSTSIGFQGHAVGYPEASPRDLHAALIEHAARWRVTDIEVDDAAPPEPLPDGAVS